MPVSFRRPPEWTIEESPWQPHRNAAWESRSTLANGYLAIRGYPEEPFVAGPTRRSILLGLPAEAGGVARVSEFLAVEIVLDGHAVLLAPGRVAVYRRTLDLAGGLLQRWLHYHVDGKTSALSFERFASLSNPHVVAQSITITPMDWAGTASLWFWFDPRTAVQGDSPMRVLQGSHVGRQRVLLATQTPQASLRIVHAGRCSGWVHHAAPPLPSLVRDSSQIALRYDVRLECAQRAVFERVVATFTSIDPEVTSAERAALEEVRGNTGPEYGTRRRKHLRAWRRRWERHDIALRGPREDQRAIRFAVFHLVQACPSAARPVGSPPQGSAKHALPLVGSAAEALALVPFLTATDPVAARELLGELSRQALARQALTGATGAPPTAVDLVPAAWYYLRCTGDTFFRSRSLLPLLASAARAWAAAPPRPGGSDALLAAWTLRLAANEPMPARGDAGSRRHADAPQTGAAERGRWQALARRLAPRGQPAVSAAIPLSARTLLLSALMPGAIPKRTLRELVGRYPPAGGVPDGSPRLPALLAIACCDLSRSDLALAWFRAGVRGALDDSLPHGGSSLHYGSLADAWLALVRGFLGMHARSERAGRAPRLPREWEGLRIAPSAPLLRNAPRAPVRDLHDGEGRI
jgi:trehalose/maltose hydrolase-like predicted phosphorylase